MHLARTKDRKEANYLVIGWKNSALAQLLFAAMMLISIFSIRITSIALMLAAALIGLIVFLIAGRKEGDA